MPKILMLCGEQRREVSPLYLQARVKVDVEPAVDGLVGRRIGKFICSKRCGPGQPIPTFITSTLENAQPGPPMNLSALPDRRAAQAPEAPAVSDDNTDLNNTQFLGAVRRASATMREHGVATGDVVAIMIPNPGQLRRGDVRGVAAGRGGHADQARPWCRPRFPTSSREAGCEDLLSSRTPLDVDLSVRDSADHR